MDHRYNLGSGPLVLVVVKALQDRSDPKGVDVFTSCGLIHGNLNLPYFRRIKAARDLDRSPGSDRIGSIFPYQTKCK